MDFVADQPAIEFCTTGASEPASDGRVVLHAMPGIVLHLHGEHWAPVYLPALAPYFVNDLTPRSGQHGYPAGAVVHLPEGLRGRRAKIVQRVDCARSPSAVVTCEGAPLARELRHDERDDVRGHVWRYSTMHGITCVRCGCAGGVRPLTAEFAPHQADYGFRAPQVGDIVCAVGDAETRNKLRAGTLDYLTGGFGRQTYATSAQSRRAILQRATSTRSSSATAGCWSRARCGRADADKRKVMTRGRRKIRVLAFVSREADQILSKWPALPKRFSAYADEFPAWPRARGLWLFVGTVSEFAGELPEGEWRRLTPAECVSIAHFGHL